MQIINFETAILANRHKREISDKAISRLTGIANQQYQLDRCMDGNPDTAPMPIRGGYVFRGLRDALVQLETAGNRALEAKRENSRASLYFKVFQLREQATTAIKSWELKLTDARRNGDMALALRARAWLDNGDTQAIDLIEEACRLPKCADSTPWPAPPSGFNAQALAHMKP